MKPEDWPATVALPGVVSEGTLRNKDLIPAFVDVLKYLAPTKNVHLAWIHSGWTRDPEGEEATEYTVALIDALDEMAPEGYYFGTIEGDGACFGFFETGQDEWGIETVPEQSVPKFDEDDMPESNEVCAARGMIALWEIVSAAENNPEALLELDANDFREAYIAAGEVLNARELS